MTARRRSFGNVCQRGQNATFDEKLTDELLISSNRPASPGLVDSSATDPTREGLSRSATAIRPLSAPQSTTAAPRPRSRSATNAMDDEAAVDEADPDSCTGRSIMVTRGYPRRRLGFLGRLSRSPYRGGPQNSRFKPVSARAYPALLVRHACTGHHASGILSVRRLEFLGVFFFESAISMDQTATSESPITTQLEPQRPPERYSKYRDHRPRRPWQDDTGRCRAPTDPCPSQDRRYGRTDHGLDGPGT